VAGGPVLQPAAQGGGGAQVRVVGAPDRDRRAGAVLVGLRAPDRQHDAAAVDELEVAGVEPNDLGAPQGAAEALSTVVSSMTRCSIGARARNAGITWARTRSRTAASLQRASETKCWIA
jgi:hypothetical protein